MRIIPLILLFLIISTPAIATENKIITVSGHSTITLEAQYSIIHADLKYVHDEIDTSYTNLQQILIDVIKNLKKLGLTDKDITKSIIRQGSEHSWKNNSRIHTGFYSSTSLQFRVNDISSLHRIYRELAKFNLLSITTTEYGRNDVEELQNIEFTKALQKARKKATLMAASLDAKRGPVIKITESTLSPGSPMVLMRSDAAPQKAGGTFGSVEISAMVLVNFALE